MTLGVFGFPNLFIRVNGFFVCFTYQASCRAQAFFFFFLIEGSLLYRIVLVSAKHQHAKGYPGRSLSKSLFFKAG